MDVIYHIIDLLLPFDWAGHIFMKNALIAVLLVTPIFGIIGTMVVNNRMAFFSDALGHSALTGIAIGVLLGIASPTWAMIIFSLLFSLGISIFKNASRVSTDTTIGVFSSMAVALGIVILSKGGGFNKYSVYLIGDLLSINQSDILTLAVAFVIVIIFWLIAFNKLMIVSINQPLAHSRGINTRLVEILFTSVVAVIVTFSIQWVGLLIINSLLVLPAAAARSISRNIRQYHVISVCIALVSGISGLILSYYWGTATGATIVLVSAVIYFSVFLLKTILRR